MQAVVTTQVLWLALAAPSLAAWSYLSEQRPDSDLARRYAWTLLALCGLARLVGGPLRLGSVDAAAQAGERYALATLAGLRQRDARLSPLRLGLLFTLTLPVERVLQRLLGFGLQLASPI